MWGGRALHVHAFTKDKCPQLQAMAEQVPLDHFDALCTCLVETQQVQPAIKKMAGVDCE